MVQKYKFAILSSLFFGVGLVINKIGLTKTTISSFEYTSYSVLVAALLSALVLVKQIDSFKGLSRQIYLYLILIGVLASGVAYILLFVGQSRTTAINAAFLSSLSAFFTIPFSKIILGSRLKRDRYKYVFLLLVGLYLLVAGSSLITFEWGDILVIMTAIIWGLTNVLSKIPMKQLSGFLVAMARLIVGSVFLLVLYLALPFEFAIGHALNFWIISSGILMWGYILFLYKAIEQNGPVMASVVLITYPLVTVVVAFVFLGEIMSWQDVLGGALMLYSIRMITSKD